MCQERTSLAHFAARKETSGAEARYFVDNGQSALQPEGPCVRRFPLVAYYRSVANCSGRVILEKAQDPIPAATQNFLSLPGESPISRNVLSLRLFCSMREFARSDHLRKLCLS